MKIENWVVQFYAEQHQKALYYALELLNGKEGQSAEEGKQQYVRQKINRLEKLLDASQDDAAKTVCQEMLPAFWSEGKYPCTSGIWFCGKKKKRIGNLF